MIYFIFSGLSSMSSLEIRVGFENPFGEDPRYLNSFCGFIEKPVDPINITNNNNITTITNNSYNNTFYNVTYGFDSTKKAYVLVNVTCQTADLQGRYITIQKRDCGQLEIHEITFSPSPSNKKVFFQTFEKRSKVYIFFNAFKRFF
jgi:hypothetical protein